MIQTLGRWCQFIKERFEPVSSLSLISIFFFSHWILFRDSSYAPDQFTASMAGLLIGTVIFFFKLRLYDEIKDYEVDCRINPTRPLARGLLRPGDLKRAFVCCIVAEIVAFSFSGQWAVLAIAGAVVYSLLMYKEFFISRLIRPHLTTYAVSHTIISSFLSLALLAALRHEAPWRLQADDYRFALNSWCLFNIFEFGRKSFASGEEREGVDSYSHIFGRLGASLLVWTMALLSDLLLWKIPAVDGSFFHLFLGVSGGLLAVISLTYVLSNKPPTAKVYRAFSSAYILLIYAGFIVFAWEALR